MTTIELENLDAATLERFKLFAKEQGVKIISIVDNAEAKDEPIGTPATENFSESVLRVGGMLAQYTDEKLTVEEMNESLAKMFSASGQTP